jgi:sugar phosphate permease
MAGRKKRRTNSEIANQSLSHPLSVALALLVVSVFINYVDRGNLSIAAPLLKNELGISASQLGLLFSAFFWTYTLMLFVCGWFVDRFDPSRVLALGYLVWSLSTAATGIVHGFAMLLLMRLILGMGESVAFRVIPKSCRGICRTLSRVANGAIIAGMKRQQGRLAPAC